MLLVACGLLLKTLFHLQRVEPGFQPSGIVTARMDLSGSSFSVSRIAGPNRPQVFTRAILERIRALPVVVSAAAAYSLPPSPGSQPETVTVEGQTYADPNSLPTGIVRAVTPGYFRTIGARLQRGRDFSDFDNEGAPDVVILNEAAAQRYFGHQDPLGQRIDIGLASHRERDPAAAPHWHEVVGVVENIRNSGLTGFSRPEMFKPDLQWAWHWAYLVVRTRGDPVALAPSLREQVKRLNLAVPVTEIRTFPQILEVELAQPRFRTALISLFGATALALAMAGVFGLQAYWVGLRTREFGIRIALGATRPQVLRMAVLNGMRLVSIGLALGLAGAAVLSRLLSTLLYGVSAADPGIYLAASAVLVVVALFSCWLPARNAASVDPLIALRSE
jgi:putative ABC transport system permease protein